MRITRHLLLAVGIAVMALLPGLAFAQSTPESRSFPDTGYTIADDAIWAFFNDHGGTATFGQPISRELTLLDSQVQLFENAALQVGPDGSVSVLPLTGVGFLPFSAFDGLSVPGIDPAVSFVAPKPDQANYAARLAAYLTATVSPRLTSVYASDVWGMPTSTLKADPHNPNFVYQRFENGILMADLSTGSAGPLAMGSYFKAVLTGQNVPADLAAEAATSPFYKRFVSNEAFTPDLG
jgi:hypothetical protein